MLRFFLKTLRVQKPQRVYLVVNYIAIDKTTILSEFYHYAQQQLKRQAAELISSDGLNEDAAKSYRSSALKQSYAS